LEATVNRGAKDSLTSVKRSFFRNPAAIAGGAALLGALLVVNVIAAMRGIESPWLLGAAVLIDVLAVGAGVLIAAREVMVADERSDASQARLAAIVDSAMDAVITVDERQTIVLFNRAAEQVFRCRREEALGAPLERFIPQRFRGAHRGHVESFGQTGVTSRRMGDVTTLWALRADGSEFPIEAPISQASEGGQRYYTVILRDITLRKQPRTSSGARSRSCASSRRACWRRARRRRRASRASCTTSSASCSPRSRWTSPGCATAAAGDAEVAQSARDARCSTRP
jgi:PAS domain S-box-containing protein